MQCLSSKSLTTTGAAYNAHHVKEKNISYSPYICQGRGGRGTSHRGSGSLQAFVVGGNENFAPNKLFNSDGQGALCNGYVSVQTRANVKTNDSDER